jgi:hypothetical protein
VHREGCSSIRQTETRSFEPNRLSLDIRSPPFVCWNYTFNTMDKE